VTGPVKLVTVGRIVAPFGRVGEVKVRIETDYPEELAQRKRLFVCRMLDEGEPREVQQVRFHKGMALVKLQGVESISGAEELRGMYLAILPEERAELDADSFWVEDVIGLEAVTESGRELGKVTEVLRGLANDVWVTPRALIPAVREFVISVDLDARRIVVRDAEGLETGQG